MYQRKTAEVIMEAAEEVADLVTPQKLSPTCSDSKSTNDLPLLEDGTHSDNVFGGLTAEEIPRSKSFDISHAGVFDRGKDPLRRSNSMDDVSRSSALTSQQEINLSLTDVDLNTEEENPPWSSRFCTNNVLPVDVKRQDVIAEFIHTEKLFLRNLILLQKAYQKPLVSHNVITPALSNRIFLNLSSLVEIHRSFKNELMGVQSSNEFVDDLGPCLTKFFANPDFQNEIVKYCINLTDSLMILKENMKNADFATFLLECESNPLCRRKHLKELLPNPMQRVTKYPLLIQQIFKYTTPDSEEYESIADVLRRVKHILSNINKEVARAESQRIEKAARARLQSDNVSRNIGESILNVPVFCDDIKQEVNLVLFERYVVLFPNDRLMLSSTSSHTDAQIEKLTRIIAVNEEDMLISADKQESKSFYLISKSTPLICLIICKTEDECKYLTETLEKVKNKTPDVKPAVEFLDLAAAQVHERNRPPSIPNEDEVLERRGSDAEHATNNSNSESGESSVGNSVQQRLDKVDAQILTLLTFKLGIMQEYYGPRKLSARARDLPQSLNQLTSDANSLHDLVLELLESYEGPDKNVMLTKVRCSFQSLVSNVGFINQNVLYAQYDNESKNSDDSKLRRGSFFERILSWKNPRDDHTAIVTEGTVTRRSTKKSSRNRANTNSPLKSSPKSSTESLNKYRLSTCSHQSTDSDIDTQVDPMKFTRTLPYISSGSRSYSKGSSARSHPHRTSTFQNIFHKSAVADEVRPVITGPVLQHTSNKSVSNTTTLDNG